MIDYKYLSSDQTYYILAGFKNIYPEFCQNDWLVWQTVFYHFTFTPIIILMAYFGNSGMATFVLYFIVSGLLVYGLIRLIRSLDGDDSLFPLVFMMMFYFLATQTSAVKLTVGTLIPTSLAPPFFVIGLALLFEKRYFLTGLFWGISGFLHLNYGYESFLLLIVFLLATSDFTSNQKYWFAPLIIVILTLPNLVPALQHFSKSIGPQAAEANRIAIYYRLSHHYVPAHFNRARVFFDIGIILLGAIECFFYWHQEKVKRAALIGMTIIVLCLGGVFFIEVVEWITYLRLHFWRFLPIASLLSIILFAKEAKEILQKDNWLKKISVMVIIFGLGVCGLTEKAVPLTLLLVILTWMILRYYHHYNSEKYQAYVLSCLIGLIIISLGQLYVFSGIKNVFLLGLGAAVITYCLSLIVIANKNEIWLVLITFLLVLFLSGSDMIIKKTTNLGKVSQPQVMIELANWAKNQTPKGTLFIAPPDIEGFRALSHRGLIVNVKCFPKKPAESLEWQKRILDLVDLKEFPDYYADQWFMLIMQRYSKLSPDYFLSLAGKYNCQYLIAYKEQSNLFQFVKKSWPLVYENPVYAVFTLPPTKQSRSDFQQNKKLI